MISNEFIDNYMVSANGEYVKIYLYILRLTLDASRSWTLSTITDKLECTSKDVLRALKYWTKRGLLQCEYTEDGDLASVTFLDPEDLQPQVGEILVQPIQTAQTVPTTQPIQTAQPVQTIQPVQTAQPVPAAQSLQPERTETITLAPERVKKLKRNKDAKLILSCASMALRHPVTQTESDTLLYFFDELHFSVELIEYLLEYCASKEACTLPYIKKVGFAWYDAGITTVEQARAESQNHHKDYYTIMQAYGLGSREPAAAERTYLMKWLNEEKFSMELILEAVNRTMIQIHDPRFSYTDSILESWKKESAHTLEDVSVLDEKHARTVTEAIRRPGSRTSSRKNGFTDYSSDREIDYDALERKLLGY